MGCKVIKTKDGGTVVCSRGNQGVTPEDSKKPKHLPGFGVSGEVGKYLDRMEAQSEQDPGKRPVKVFDLYLKAETDRAYGVFPHVPEGQKPPLTREIVWIPKSQIVTQHLKKKEGGGKVEIPLWLADAKGLDRDETASEMKGGRP